MWSCTSVLWSCPSLGGGHLPGFVSIPWQPYGRETMAEESGHQAPSPAGAWPGGVRVCPAPSWANSLGIRGGWQEQKLVVFSLRPSTAQRATDTPPPGHSARSICRVSLSPGDRLRAMVLSVAQHRGRVSGARPAPATPLHCHDAQPVPPAPQQRCFPPTPPH